MKPVTTPSTRGLGRKREPWCGGPQEPGIRGTQEPGIREPAPSRKAPPGTAPTRSIVNCTTKEATAIYRWLRKALFTRDPEDVHHTALKVLAWLGRHPTAARLVAGGPPAAGSQPDPRLACTRWGIAFPGPIGVAAGFDKDGVAVRGLAALGFHFVEAGTVTPRPQPGNPRPRLFRLPEEEALVNRLGFNNEGAGALRRRLEALASPGGAGPSIPVGVNIGKNRDTPLARAADDYVACLRILYPVGDYYTVNLSSPNTPGLRELQTGSYVSDLLAAVREELDRLSRGPSAAPHGAGDRPAPPLLLKIAPDLDEPSLEHVLEAVQKNGFSGLIVANTWPHPEGGLSGRPLREHGERLVAAVYRRVGSSLPIIGVGGIFTAADAYARIRAGASLVQLYTGFVYGGPRTATSMAAGLRAMLERDGLANVDAAVGVDADRLPDPWTEPTAAPRLIPLKG